MIGNGDEEEIQLQREIHKALEEGGLDILNFNQGEIDDEVETMNVRVDILTKKEEMARLENPEEGAGNLGDIEYSDN